MTARQVYTLVCDGCGKRYVTEQRLASDARTDAANEGWRYVIAQVSSGPNPSVDTCPECESAEGIIQALPAPRPSLLTAKELGWVRCFVRFVLDNDLVSQRELGERVRAKLEALG